MFTDAQAQVGAHRDRAPRLRSSGPFQVPFDRAMAPRSWCTHPTTAVGFHAVLRSQPLCTCARCDDLLPFSRGVHDDLAAGGCRQIGELGPKRWEVPQDDIQAALPTRARPGWRKASSTRSTWGTCEPDRSPCGFDTMVKGANAQARIGRQGLCQQGQPGRLHGRYRDGIMRMAACHRSLRAREQRGGRLSSNRRLRDCAMPMPRCRAA